MKSTFVLIAALLSLPLYAQVEEAYYDNGARRAKFPLNSAGRYEGIAHTYYLNGNLSASIAYREGQKEGLEQAYYEGGILRYQVPYQQGQRHGQYVGYYPDGSVKIRQDYVYGRKEGHLLAYYPEGQLRMYGLLQADSVCFAQHFDRAGRLLSERLGYVALPLDTGALPGPQVFGLPANGGLAPEQPQQLQVVLPRIPTAFIHYAAAGAQIRRLVQGYLEVTPLPGSEGVTLYLRIQTHSDAQPGLLRIVRLPVVAAQP